MLRSNRFLCFAGAKSTTQTPFYCMTHWCYGWSNGGAAPRKIMHILRRTSISWRHVFWIAPSQSMGFSRVDAAALNIDFLYVWTLSSGSPLNMMFLTQLLSYHLLAARQLALWSSKLAFEWMTHHIVCVVCFDRRKHDWGDGINFFALSMLTCTIEIIEDENTRS